MRRVLIASGRAMARFLPLGRAGIPAVPLAGLLLIAVAAASVAPEVLLVLAPALLLLGLLFAGQAPGEQLLLRLARRARRARPATSLAPPRLPLLVRRTGRLIASALAMRPPPARSAIPCG